MLQTAIESNAYALHARLAKHNLLKTNIATPCVNWEQEEQEALENRILEGHYLEGLRSSIKSLTPELINSADDFINWFDALAECGPGQNHELFDWLETDATVDQLKWFLTQEMASDTGFEDLVAYTQVKLPPIAKLECARNFWDEMGRGKQGATQSLLLGRIVHGLKLQPAIETTLWESLARDNVMLGLATTRRYAYHSLGALGVAELVSVSRATKISACMTRLGVEPWIRSYFDLKIALK
ncbi:MAG: iron-containing redox enzyme family protein, partial [Chitinophagaceae bacterium]